MRRRAGWALLSPGGCYQNQALAPVELVSPAIWGMREADVMTGGHGSP